MRRRASSLLVVVGAISVASSGAAQTAGARSAKPTKQECVAANESAQDLQNAGKLRDAEEQLRTCTNKACPGMVRDDCVERLRQVQAAIPTVVFLLRDPDGIDVGSSAVTEMDGAPLPAVLDGTPIPVDPGDHTFKFTVAGRPPATRRISLRAGERLRRDVQLKAEPSRGSTPPEGAAAGVVEPAQAPESPVATPAPVGPPAPETPGTEGRAGGGARVAGFAALGAGGAGLLLSAIFGAVAIGKKSALLKACPDHQCPQSQQSEIDSFDGNLVAGNVALAVGLVGVGVGSGLLFLWPSASKATTPVASTVTPWLGVGAAGLRGSFR